MCLDLNVDEILFWGVADWGTEYTKNFVACTRSTTTSCKPLISITKKRAELLRLFSL